MPDKWKSGNKEWRQLSIISLDAYRKRLLKRSCYLQSGKLIGQNNALKSVSSNFLTHKTDYIKSGIACIHWRDHFSPKNYSINNLLHSITYGFLQSIIYLYKILALWKSSLEGALKFHTSGRGTKSDDIDKSRSPLIRKSPKLSKDYKWAEPRNTQLHPYLRLSRTIFPHRKTLPFARICSR